MSIISQIVDQTEDDLMLRKLLTEHDTAEALSVSTRTLQRWRVQGGAGPKFVKLGHSVRYRVEDIEAFIASRVVGSTSEERH